MAIPADKLAAEAAEAESESAGRRWTDHVARTTAVLAVLAAVASGAYANQFSQTILSQTEASDQWSYYQAKSIKKHISTGQLEMERALAAGRPELVPALAQLEAAASATAKRYDAELAGIKARAETLDATKARHQKQGDRFQYAFVVLQAGRLVNPPALPSDHVARLVQENIPAVEGSDWTEEYFKTTLKDLTALSLTTPNGERARRYDLIVWPESPAPFYTTDPTFRDAISNIARESQAWVLAGGLGIRNASQTPRQATEVYNSASLISPSGDWVGRYDKVHLVPFGEYVPFKRVFAFAGGLTKEVGDFARGTSRAPLDAGGTKLGVFICYESIFPDEVRRSAANGAQVFVNISNDGWYGDSGAYAQHLKQARMRAVENARWLLRDTNTGVTASIDPYGRIVARVPRKVRTVLNASYAVSNVTTLYTRHGDWFAYLCAIISVVALLAGLLKSKAANR